MEAFRGNLDNARRLFREGKSRCRPSSRYLREWGAFEKRAGSLDVSLGPTPISLLCELNSLEAGPEHIAAIPLARC